MEVYAAFLEHTDHHVGRLIDTLEGPGRVLDDTLVYLHHRRQRRFGRRHAERLLQRDGGPERHAASIETPEFLRWKIDEFGGRSAYNHYAVGWAHAMNTPYQWTKQVASHWGGTRNGTIVHWPNGIKAKGEIRTQFNHVIDIAPTVLEAAGMPEPTIVNSVQQSAVSRARAWLYCVQRREGAGAARDAVLRDVLQPRHLPQGLDAP